MNPRILELQQKIAAAKAKKAAKEESSLARQAAMAGASLGAGAIGGIPDLAASIYNLPAVTANALGAELPYIPSATEAVRKKIDELTGGYTTPRTPIERDIARGLEFVGSLPAGGPIAKGLGTLGKAPKAAEFLGKTSKLTPSNIGGALGAGVGAQEAQENFGDSDIGGLTSLAAVFGGGAVGAYAGKNIGSLPKLMSPKVNANLSTVFPEGTQLDRSFIEEGMRLEREQGIPFTAGELTGNQDIRALEDALANAKYTQKFASHRAQNLEKLAQNHEQLLEKLSPRDIDSEVMGEKLVSSFKKTANAARELRRQRAKEGFSEVDKLSKGTGTIGLENTLAKLEELAAEKEAVGLSEVAKKQGEEFKRWKDSLQKELKKNGGLMTASDANKNLMELTSGSSAVGRFFKDLETAADRRPASELKAALLEDIRSSAEKSSNPEIAKKLLETRNNYYEDSQVLDRLKNSTIAKVLGKSVNENVEFSGQDIAEKFNKLSHQGIKNTLETLKEADPELVQDTRRFFLQRAADKALSSKGQLGASELEPTFNGRQFLSELPDDKKLAAIFEGDEKAVKEIKSIVQAIDRLERLGTKKGGSPTANRLSKGVFSEAYNALKNPLGFAIEKGISLVKDSDVVTDILLDPKLRNRAIKNQLRKEDLARLEASYAERTANQLGRLAGTEEIKEPKKKRSKEELQKEIEALKERIVARKAKA